MRAWDVVSNTSWSIFVDELPVYSHKKLFIPVYGNSQRCCATMQDIKFAVHAHPTLSEVLDELFKSAKVKYPLFTSRLARTNTQIVSYSRCFNTCSPIQLLKQVKAQASEPVKEAVAV